MGSFGKVKRLFDYAQSLLDNGYKPEYVFDKVGPDREGISTIYIDDKSNFLNLEEGKILSKQWFDDTWYFRGGVAKVKLNGMCNLINTEGKIVCEEWLGDVWDFNDGLAIVELNGKWNFVNTEGKFLSEQWFDKVWRFTDKGYAFVMLDGEGMFIDDQGKKYSIVK